MKFRCHKTHFLPKFERFTIQPCQNLASENNGVFMFLGYHGRKGAKG